MKKFILLFSMLLIAFSLFSQQKNGRKFEMFRPKFHVIDETRFEKKVVKRYGSQDRTVIDNALSYSDDDIKIKIETVDSDVKLKCQEILENGVVVDTIVLAVRQVESTKWNGSKPVYRYAFVNLKPTQRLRDYVQADYQRAIQNRNQMHQKHLSELKQYQELELREIEVAKLAAERDSIERVEAEKRAEQRRIDEEERQQYQQKQLQIRVLGQLRTEFTEPTSTVRTKSGTKGIVKYTYEYYIGEDGYEVKHGKYAENATFNNYESWNITYGSISLNGTESMTCYYRNGIPHGKMSYKCDIKVSSTYGRSGNVKETYDLQIYKGFLTGSFKFTHKGKTYTGKAVDGILDYCDYETTEGYHGKLSSVSNNPAYLSIAEINGYELTNIDLEDYGAKMPIFRFPLIGSNN